MSYVVLVIRRVDIGTIPAGGKHEESRNDGREALITMISLLSFLHLFFHFLTLHWMEVSSFMHIIFKAD